MKQEAEKDGPLGEKIHHLFHGQFNLLSPK